MIRKNIFGGCNIKPKTCVSINDTIYYCSNTNILITDDVKVIDVIFLEGYLNFVKAKGNLLLSGDVLGNCYFIKNRKIKKISFSNSIQDGCFIGKDLVVCMFLKFVIIYDVINDKTKIQKNFDFILSAMFYVEKFIFLGTADGILQIYDESLNLKFEVKGHDDRIQDIKGCIIENRIYIATCSKDCTIKIWDFVFNSNIDPKVCLMHKQTLVGHHDWVYEINWHSNFSLISSSADKSIMIWNYFENITWECESILGGAKSFLSGFLFKDCVIGLSQTGSFYKFDECTSDFISGHIDTITSLDWNGKYLLSTSIDKTARIFYENREIGRPVTHGYELSAGRFLNNDNLNCIIGSQETIIRIFTPTYIFHLSCEWMKKNLKQIEDLHFSIEDDCKIAAVPADLSLTNDVIEDYDFQNVNKYLLSTTTFVESKKIYGHYFEVSDIAVSKDFIASCNKSLTKKFSGVFLWNKKFEILDYLEVHSFGITKLRFSLDGKYLCSVSKDKISCIYEIKEDNKLEIKYINNDHKRIIWDCAFSYDTEYYATCSRDKKIFIYNLSKNDVISILEFTEEVCSIDFSPVNYLLIAGIENGFIYKIKLTNNKFEILDEKIKGHSQSVTAIKFDKTGTFLSTGGKDGLINIFYI